MYESQSLLVEGGNLEQWRNYYILNRISHFRVQYGSCFKNTVME